MGSHYLSIYAFPRDAFLKKTHFARSQLVIVIVCGASLKSPPLAATPATPVNGLDNPTSKLYNIMYCGSPEANGGEGVGDVAVLPSFSPPLPALSADQLMGTPLAPL